MDLGHGVSSKGILCVLADVDVAGQLGSATLVDDVGLDLGVSDQSRVLLAGVDGRAVPGEFRVDWGHNGKQLL